MQIRQPRVANCAEKLEKMAEWDAADSFITQMIGYMHMDLISRLLYVHRMN